MRGRSYNAVMDAYAWDYSDERFLQVRYEDVARDFPAQFQRIFDWMGIRDRTAIDVALEHDLNRMPASAIAMNAHVTDKSLRGNAVSELPEAAVAAFRELFPADVISRLGYRQP